MIKLSVIVPTYNRKNALLECMHSLFNQTCSKLLFEIIVIDDGSTDETGLLIDEVKRKSPVVLRYFRQENKGPAAARNVGIKKAKGGIVLFMGDDTAGSVNLVEDHLAGHAGNPENNIALLGYTTWSEHMTITPFLEYLETGPQFRYSEIKDPENVSYDYFYTTNISLKKDFLDAHGYFDEDFKLAMWEDIELGYRLSQHGLKLHYNREAIVYHHHPSNIRKWMGRQYNVGKYAVLFLSKHLELKESMLPQLLNPFLLLSDNQTDELVHYFSTIEDSLLSQKFSAGDAEITKESLFSLYQLLLMAQYAKGFLEELSSHSLLKTQQVDVAKLMNQRVQDLTILPLEPPPFILTLMQEFNNQKDAGVKSLLNSWSWKITAPLRKLHTLIYKTHD